MNIAPAALKLPTGRPRALLNAIAAADTDPVTVYRDGRRPYRLGSWSGPAFRFETFGRLRDEGWIEMIHGFSGSLRVSLTAQARDALLLGTVEPTEGSPS